MTYTLGVERRTAAATRSTPATFAAPAPWEVRAFAPGAFNEDGSQNRDRVEVAWTVYADKSDDAPTVFDRVTLLGKSFDVNGEPQDWTHGLGSSSFAGIVVELKRTEG